ncbi:MAG: hypothetical protein IKD90_07285 [Clostridiales bacterium]|nr:hypothetical protein [Clostridiales bacterium]
MKRSKLIQFLSVILSLSVFLFSLSACKKNTDKVAAKSTASEEDEDDEDEDEDETTTKATKATVSEPSLDVLSLDQFISDGSIFAEDVVLPTPTPIPVSQAPLGLSNDGRGYYSGTLEKVNVIDNQYFRYTIFKVEKDAEHYYVHGEFENKTDSSFGLRFMNPTVDNETNDFYFYIDAPMEPKSVLQDTTDFAKCVSNYNGQDLTRISFLLLATDPENKNTIYPISDNNCNYVLVNLFPQGEDAFVYEEAALPDTADILVDTEGALFSIDSFDLNDSQMIIHYTFRNKTGDYLQLKLKDKTIMVDDTVFDELGSQTIYIAPYSTCSNYFFIRKDRFDKVKLNPINANSISIPILVNSLSDGVNVLWERIVKAEVEYG